MDNRRYISSGRCLFSGERHTIAIDFKNMDIVDIEDCVSNRRILYTLRTQFGSRDFYQNWKPINFENDLVLVSTFIRRNDQIIYLFDLRLDSIYPV